MRKEAALAYVKFLLNACDLRDWGAVIRDSRSVDGYKAQRHSEYEIKD
jgi:hypothetical protein